DELEALGSSVHIASVVGFPLGANMPIIKAIEADFAIEAGANEIDMVLPIGKLKENTREAAEYVTRDIAGVVEVCRDRGALCKVTAAGCPVIIETCLLTKEEIEKAVMLCAAAGADYVKTSTGFSTGGATVENVKLMATLCDESK
ncbi:deoC, partial [Symbiodinium sp. KB8]